MLVGVWEREKVQRRRMHQMEREVVVGETQTTNDISHYFRKNLLFFLSARFLKIGVNFPGFHEVIGFYKYRLLHGW